VKQADKVGSGRNPAAVGSNVAEQRCFLFVETFFLEESRRFLEELSRFLKKLSLFPKGLRLNL